MFHDRDMTNEEAIEKEFNAIKKNSKTICMLFQFYSRNPLKNASSYMQCYAKKDTNSFTKPPCDLIRTPQQ